MWRCNENVLSQFFVFFLAFVTITNVVSSHKTTWHYKNSIIEQDSESPEIVLKSSIFISRLLKTSPTMRRSTENHHSEINGLSRFPHATLRGHTSKPNLRIRPPTSCGQITCDSVPGYPEDIIIEVAKSTNLIQESPKESSLSKKTFPVARSLDHSISNNHDIHPPERVQDCAKLINEIVIYPRESVNEKDQVKLVVNLPQYNFGPLARECSGPEACIDATTPERKVFSCTTDYTFQVVETFSPESQKIEKHRVKIPIGCKCGLRDQ